MLHLTVPFGDTIVIDDGRVLVTFEKKSGQEVKVSIEADRTIPVKVLPRERRTTPWAKGLTGSNPHRKSDAGKSSTRAHEGSMGGEPSGDTPHGTYHHRPER